jgi:hypothetical protein
VSPTHRFSSLFLLNQAQTDQSPSMGYSVRDYEHSRRLATRPAI